MYTASLNVGDRVEYIGHKYGLAASQRTTGIKGNAKGAQGIITGIAFEWNGEFESLPINTPMYAVLFDSGVSSYKYLFAEDLRKIK